ncbi:MULTISPECIES: carbohydrate ABC transporter permease [Streptomyces]|uniref:Carbohydrate ABC transporter permease n=1 Tax=Streptomyces lycii TaxID=2654337 RepID=A0ABQ7FGC2_9ACTN|nr:MULTISPECIES: carbohydrate ABC transporter permease [Streptomyces]KAF4407680.1 carbohydrate ABC transporter permease [Streptomyces lycii]PGH46748.1 sugar ABC transporter permease [Streptomyces sp. Ru87]
MAVQTGFPAPAGARSAAPGRRRAEAGRGGGRLIIGESRLARRLALGALAVMSLAWLLPLLWAVVTSFKTDADASSADHWVLPPEGWTATSYRTVLEQGDVLLWMFNSLVIAAAVTVITLVVSAMAGYAFSRTVFKGRKQLFAVTVASILVPGQLLIVPWFQQMLTLGLVDTYAAVILPQVVAPIMVYILKKFFDGIPRELEEAARIDGAGHWRVFRSIVLPLSRPMLAAVGIFVFIGAWNNFLWPFIVTSDPSLMTLPVGLTSVKNAYGVQYAQTMASAVLGALPLLVVFMLFQRHIVKSVATTGLGGQ